MKRANAITRGRGARRGAYYQTFDGGRDTGQRYEVRYRDGMGTERMFGYAADEKGVEGLKRRLSKNPSWKFSRTIDRDMIKTAEVVK